MACIYGAIYFALLIYFGNKESIFFGGFLLVIGLLFTSKGKTLSKKIKGFKTVYASASWSFVTVIFTAVYCSYSNILPIIFLFMFVTLRVIINTSFSDFKDIESDRRRGIITLPMLFKTKNNGLNFLHAINILSCALIIFGAMIQILPTYVLFLLISSLYNLYYIQKGKQEKTNISALTHVFVDGENYYWPFLVFIGMVITL
jgi:4-hydroxybenzoate polyprenyltransferase